MRILFAFLIALCAGCPCPGQETDRLEGLYLSSKYLCSAEIPKGIVASQIRPPAPDHGFTIKPHRGADDEVWLNAEYDALDLENSEALARQMARGFSGKYHLAVVDDSPSQLYDLPARDLILRGSNGSGKIRYVHLLVAFRRLPNRAVGIVYTVGLQARAEDAAMNQIFLEIAGSFQTMAP
jgi:hypothetical protein